VLATASPTSLCLDGLLNDERVSKGQWLDYWKGALEAWRLSFLLFSTLVNYFVTPKLSNIYFRIRIQAGTWVKALPSVPRPAHPPPPLPRRWGRRRYTSGRSGGGTGWPRGSGTRSGCTQPSGAARGEVRRPDPMVVFMWFFPGLRVDVKSLPPPPRLMGGGSPTLIKRGFQIVFRAFGGTYRGSTPPQMGWGFQAPVPGLWGECSPSALLSLGDLSNPWGDQATGWRCRAVQD